MSKTASTQPPAVPVIPADQQAARPHRRRFTESFKRDTVRLVTHEGYTFKAAAQAVGVSEKSLRTWRHRYAPPGPACGPDASAEQLRQENQPRCPSGPAQTCRAGAGDFKKSHGLLREGVVMRYQWIQQHRDVFPVAAMCRVLQGVGSGYYGWLGRRPGPRAQRPEKIQGDVRQAFEQSGGVYGSRKIVQVLQQQDQMESACRNTVAKAMRPMGLQSCVTKRFKPTTTVADPSKAPAPNVLDQDFQADGPNRKWVTDIIPMSIGTHRGRLGLPGGGAGFV